MSHPVERALLLDVLQNPADDAPRLILADWLSEHDHDVRADMIRCQVWGQKLPWHVQRYFDKLHWVSPDYNWQCAGHFSWDMKNDPEVETTLGGVLMFWRRGFVEKLYCSTQDWLARGPALVKATPLSQVVLIDRRPAEVRTPGTTMTRYAWFPIVKPLLISPARIPPDIHACFPQPTYRLDFDTTQEALDALSEASLKWARLT